MTFCRPKLIYLVTEDWYFWSHRLPMARAARDAGFDVGVATRAAEHGDRIRSEGFSLHPLAWRRKSFGGVEALRSIHEIASLYRRERPDIVHHVALKPTVFGSIAARFAGVPGVVNALTGLGYVFTSQSPKARLLKAAIVPLLGRLLDHPGYVLLLQNNDDRHLLCELGVTSAERCIIIRGSGVDLDHYRPLPEPADGPVTAAVVGRITEDKGIRTLVAAYRILRSRGSDLRLLLVGAPDPENPAAISEVQLRRWETELPGLEWCGRSTDVRNVWARTHIAVQSSHGGEGLPMSLLEAAACGRPLVATDVPGCREIALPADNGLLVPPGDPERLADALAALASDPVLRRRMGEASRRIVEGELSAESIGRQIVALYQEVLGASGAAVLPAPGMTP